MNDHFSHHRRKIHIHTSSWYFTCTQAQAVNGMIITASKP
jgi:hypothetical protein